MQTVTVSLPKKIYNRLQYAAQIAGKPLHEVAARSITESLPPLLDSIPARYRREISALEKLGERALWEVARSRVEASSQRRYARLLKKSSRGAELSEKDRQSLEELCAIADRVMLQKAYALLLLKLRGNRVPRLAELDRRE